MKLFSYCLFLFSFKDVTSTANSKAKIPTAEQLPSTRLLSLLLPNTFIVSEAAAHVFTSNTSLPQGKLCKCLVLLLTAETALLKPGPGTGNQQILAHGKGVSAPSQRLSQHQELGAALIQSHSSTFSKTRARGAQLNCCSIPAALQSCFLSHQFIPVNPQNQSLPKSGQPAPKLLILGVKHLPPCPGHSSSLTSQFQAEFCVHPQVKSILNK